MLGLSVGDKKTITLDTEDAFGEPNPGNIHHLPRSRFPADMHIEKDVAIAFDQAGGNEMVGVVKECDDGFVTVDFNHPLSGQTIVFDVEIVELLDS